MSALETTLEGTDRVRAGARVPVRLRLRAREPLRAGASIRLATPLGWTPPSLDGGPGQVRWTVDGHAAVLGEVVRRRYVQLNLTGGRLDPGEGIAIAYGGAPDGAAVQPWVTDVPATFEVEVSRDGDGAYVVDSAAAIVVEPGAPAHLHVIAPSGGRPGEQIPVRIRVLDEFGNLCASCSAEALVRGGGAVGIERGCGSAHVVFPRNGVYRVEVAVGGLHLLGRSNPCRITADGQAPWWGDPHVHTVLSDGVGSPAFALRYARDVACLDFTAITDHDVEYHHAWFVRRLQRLSDDAWRGLAETIGRCRVAGRFAVLRAYEWTGRPYGDRCVYLRSDHSPIRRYEPGDAPTLDALWRGLKQIGPDETLVVPHTTASSFMGTDWTEHDGDLEALVEVYSMHGASECPGGPGEMTGAGPGRHVRDALSRGYRLGFVAGGDMHSGQPGNPVLAVGPYRTLRFKPGLTAVFADRLDEGAIFDAMRERRTYATTGARILVWFSVNDVP
ncbi:MAG: DUF3604 domain-containing protein, partial [Armatimonadota bacterium]|nr:DUF3604 domain-containing protein [Armatimonadota bacterium]